MVIMLGVDSIRYDIHYLGKISYTSRVVSTES